jgi:cytochrome c553
MRSDAALVLAAALAVAGAGVWAQPAPTAAPAAVGPEACTACHGPGGNSQIATMPSIAAQPRTFIENQLVLIREGLRDVPAMKAVMGSLNDEQIVMLAKHFAALPATAPAGPVKPELFKAGADVSKRALCGTCHLPGYVGQSQVPRLAGQQEAYLATTLKMYRDAPDPGRDTAMSAVLHGLKDADLAALAHYFAQQPGPASK